MSNRIFISMEHCEVNVPVVDYSGTQLWKPYYWGNEFYYDNDTYDSETLSQSGWRHAETHLKLQTGGRALPHRENLFCIGVSVLGMPYKRAVPDFAGEYLIYEDIPEMVTVGTGLASNWWTSVGVIV